MCMYLVLAMFGKSSVADSPVYFPNTNYLAHRCNRDVLGETMILSSVREVVGL